MFIERNIELIYWTQKRRRLLRRKLPDPLIGGLVYYQGEIGGRTGLDGFFDRLRSFDKLRMSGELMRLPRPSAEGLAMIEKRHAVVEATGSFV